MADRLKFSDGSGLFGNTSEKVGSIADQLLDKLMDAADELSVRGGVVGTVRDKAGHVAEKVGSAAEPVATAAAAAVGAVAGKIGAKFAGRKDRSAVYDDDISAVGGRRSAGTSRMADGTAWHSGSVPVSGPEDGKPADYSGTGTAGRKAAAQDVREPAADFFRDPLGGMTPRPEYEGAPVFMDPLGGMTPRSEYEGAPVFDGSIDPLGGAAPRMDRDDVSVFDDPMGPLGGMTPRPDPVQEGRAAQDVQDSGRDAAGPEPGGMPAWVMGPDGPSVDREPVADGPEGPVDGKTVKPDASTLSLPGVEKGAVSDYFGLHLEDARNQYGHVRMKSVRLQDPLSADGCAHLIVPESSIQEMPSGFVNVRLGSEDAQAIYVRMDKDGSLRTVPMSNDKCLTVCEAGRDGRGSPLWTMLYGDVDPVMQRNYLRNVPAGDIEMEAASSGPRYRIRIPDKLSGVDDVEGHRGYGELIVEGSALKRKEDGTFDVDLNGMLDSVSHESAYYRWTKSNGSAKMEKVSLNPAIIASNYNRGRDEHVFLHDVPFDRVIPNGVDPETGKPTGYDVVTPYPSGVFNGYEGENVKISVDADAVSFREGGPDGKGTFTVDLGRALDRIPVACKNCYFGHAGKGAYEAAMDGYRTGSKMVDLYAYETYNTGTGEPEKGFMRGFERADLAEAARLQARRDRIAEKSSPVMLKGVDPESVGYYEGPDLNCARRAVGEGSPLVVRIPDPKVAPAPGEKVGYGQLFVSDSRVWPGPNGKLKIELGDRDGQAVYMRPRPDGKLARVEMHNDEAAVVCESGLFGYITDETRKISARSRDLTGTLGLMQDPGAGKDRQAGE